MMGYAYREDATRKDMTEDGWLRTGDLADIDNEGYHRIVGREKDLIITAGGENVPPVLIEDSIIEELPCLSNAMLIGDRRKFLSCLLTLKVEVDADTLEPTDKLASAAVDWCKEIGSKAKTVDEAINDPAVTKAIQSSMDRVNGNATSNAQVKCKVNVQTDQ